MDILTQIFESPTAVMLALPNYIKNIIAETLEVDPFAELRGRWLFLFVALLEGEEVTKHIHNRLLGLSLGEVLDALLDPPQLCRLPKVQIVLQLLPDTPSDDEELTNNVSREMGGEAVNQVGGQPIIG